MPERKRLKHEVPHGILSEDEHALFFITVCCQNRELNSLAKDEVWPQLLETVINRNERGIWNCSLLVAMPDHVHGLFRFESTTRMTKAFKDWKRWTARQHAIAWQDGFFDHRLRSRDSAAAKRRYILENPVRAGLVEKAEDWPYAYDAIKR